MGPEIAIVDSAETTAAAVETQLQELNLLRETHSPVSRQYLVTDAPERFARVGQLFLGTAIDPKAVELVDLQ